MVRHSALVLTLLTILTLKSAAGDDFKCFQCSSDRDASCWDPVGNSLQATDCDSVEHQAKIYFQKTKNVFKDIFSSIISNGAAPSSQNFHYACLKTITSVEGRKEVRRKCTLDTSEVIDDGGVPVPDECSAMGSYTSYCGICKTESCNSAPKAASAMGLIVSVCCCLLLKMLL